MTFAHHDQITHFGHGDQIEPQSVLGRILSGEVRNSVHTTQIFRMNSELIVPRCVIEMWYLVTVFFFCNCLWYKVFLLFTIYKQSQKQNRKNLQKKLRNMKVVEENNRKIALNWLWNLKVRVSKWEKILGKQLFVCVYRKTSQWFIYRLNIKIMYIRIQQSVKDFRCILRSMKTK